MSKTDRTSLIGILGAVTVGAIIAWAGSDGSEQLGSISIFVLCAVVAFAINWVAFIPSAIAKTEHYYDLVGSITYLSVTVLALALSTADRRAWVIATLVVIWAARLGSFLFARVRKAGRDGRFDQAKNNPLQFLMFWTLQGLWVFLTLACGLAAITAIEKKSLGAVGFLGIAIWIIGFSIEVVSDRQKSAFRADPANRDQFITTGLWAWSRHPNYFGEIVLWTGIAVLAIPVLSGWRWLTLISPLFVYVLLTRISGVPLLEARAAKKWGGDEAFEAYKRTTPSLFPRPPSKRESSLA